MKGKQFLFEKRNTKTFSCWGLGLSTRAHLKSQKFFGSFFQKRTTFLALLLCAAAPAPPWYPLDPDNTLIIETEHGRIVIEMRPDFAPQSVARVKLLAREHVYDGLLFHRVIDHYVDQTGNPNNHDGGVSEHPNLPAEFHTSLKPSQIDAIATQSSDGITGFVGVQPFAATPDLHQPGHWRAWGLYCDGVAGMGRQEAADTGNSEIFFTRAPARGLDHDYTVWGRVVSGSGLVHMIAVGDPPAHPDRMTRVRVLADIPPGERPKMQVIDTSSAAFHDTIARLRAKLGADFTVCDVPIALRVVP